MDGAQQNWTRKVKRNYYNKPFKIEISQERLKGGGFVTPPAKTWGLASCLPI